MSLSMTASLMLHRPYLRVLQNVGSAEMLERVAFRRVLSAPSTWSNSFLPTFRINAQSVLSARFSSTLPTVAKPSFWASLVPKPLRRGAAPAGAKIKAKKSTEWNPATFFIIILLLIGSMSIQMIALKNGDATFTRRADARITLLKEIIEKVQNGEEVDVEGLLGTGDPKREQEWEDLLKDIEREDELWKESQRKKTPRITEIKEQGQASASDETSKLDIAKAKSEFESRKPIPRSNAPRGFY